MTRDEFERAYTAYEWEPYQPLAVFLADGTRTYIDKPEQATLAAEELVITRWQNPRRPERHRYADIRALVPLMELPADPGGMQYAEFDALIRGLLMADPFEPFAIELKDGRRVELARRGGTTRAGRFINVRDGDALRVGVTFDQVARLVPTPVAAAGGA